MIGPTSAVAAAWSFSTRLAARRASKPSMLAQVKRAISVIAPTARRPCTRPVRRIIRRWVSVHSRFIVSARMPVHSSSEGKWRFSGRAPQRSCALGQPQLGPTPARFALLAGEPVAQRPDQVVVCKLVRAGG